MADTYFTIRQYNLRDWKLEDLRALVEELAEWPGDCDVLLTAPKPHSPAGTVEVRHPAHVVEPPFGEGEGE